MNGTKLTTSAGTTVLADEWWYDPTYLIGHEGTHNLFVRRFAVVETQSGNRRLRIGSDVEAYPSEEEMVAAIRERDMSEAPQEWNDDREWAPDHLRELLDA